MGKMLDSNHEVVNHLISIFNLPKNIKKFVITAELDEFVRIEVEYYPQEEDLKKYYDYKIPK